MAPPPPNAENPATKCAKTFLSCLTEEAGYYITNLPPSGALKPAQLAVLRKISDHFFQESHGSQRDARSVSHVDQAQSMDFDEGSLMEDQEILDNPEASSPARQTKSVTGDNQTPVGGSAAERGTNISSPLNSAPKRRGRPKKTEGTTTNTSNQLWGTVLAKTEFNLEISLREHLESNNAFDATRCLKSTPPSLETPLEEHWERFLKFCEDITELPTSTPRESVDRLFLLLAVGDIALHTCGPKWSSKGGNPQKEKILAQLGNNRYKNLQEIFKMADRLMFICECREFGIGCIFWLYGEFNNNFLSRRVTKDGERYDEVMKHVQEHGLAPSIKASGANEMGEAVRLHLRRFYRVEQTRTEGTDVVRDGEEDASGLGDIDMMGA